MAFIVPLLAGLIGCAAAPPPLEPPELNPATATADYWLKQPAEATVFSDNYDKLWNTCEELARNELFELDREDYRDGLLTTKPLVSKQIFEPWRPDTGDTYEVVQNSLQTIRRTIEFDFEKLPGGYTVTPKVVVERLASRNPHITSTAEYGGVVTGAEAGAMPAVGAQNETTPPYWYAINRDRPMEAQLAKTIEQRLGS